MFGVKILYRFGIWLSHRKQWYTIESFGIWWQCRLSMQLSIYIAITESDTSQLFDVYRLYLKASELLPLVNCIKVRNSTSNCSANFCLNIAIKWQHICITIQYFPRIMSTFRALLRFIVTWYLSILPTPFTVTSLRLLYDSPSASEVTLENTA